MHDTMEGPLSGDLIGSGEVQKGRKAQSTPSHRKRLRGGTAAPGGKSPIDAGVGGLLSRHLVWRECLTSASVKTHFLSQSPCLRNTGEVSVASEFCHLHAVLLFDYSVGTHSALGSWTLVAPPRVPPPSAGGSGTGHEPGRPWESGRGGSAGLVSSKSKKPGVCSRGRKAFYCPLRRFIWNLNRKSDLGQPRLFRIFFQFPS